MTSDQGQTESELISRFKEGEEDALRTLFTRCQDVMEVYVDRLMSKAIQRRVSVADVLQDARIIAFERREDLEDRGPGSFRNWFLGIAVKKAHRAVQRHAQVPMRSVDMEVTRGSRPATAAFAGKAASPSQAAIGSEMEDMAIQAMSMLSIDHREVLQLTCIDRLTLAEAAKHMGRSNDAVRKLQERALLKFTKIYNRMQGGEDD